MQAILTTESELYPSRFFKALSFFAGLYFLVLFVRVVLIARMHGCVVLFF